MVNIFTNYIFFYIFPLSVVEINCKLKLTFITKLLDNLFDIVMIIVHIALKRRNTSHTNKWYMTIINSVNASITADEISKVSKSN